MNGINDLFGLYAMKGGGGGVSAIGRYLAIWDCTTGLPTTQPATIPYDYVTGDYFIIGNVSPSDKITYDGISEGKEIFSDYAVKVSDRTFENPEDLYGTVITMNDGTTITVDNTNCFKNAQGTMITIMSGSFPQVLVVLDSEESTPGTYFLDMRITIVQTPMWTSSWTLADGTNYMPDGTTYDGTASTTEDTGSPQVLDMYRFDGTNWAWLNFGAKFRQILTDYYTKTESDGRYAPITALDSCYENVTVGSDIVTMSDLRTYVDNINAQGKHVLFDMHTFISGAYVCLITLTESGGTYYCVINDLLNDNIYTTYTGYLLTDTISEFVTDCTVKGGYRSIKIPANATTEDVRKLLESINAKGEHVFFDLSDMSAFSTYKQGYVCLVFCEYQSSSHYDIFHVIPLLGEYTYEFFAPDGNYSFQAQLNDDNKIGRQPMVINKSVSAGTGICEIKPGEYGWLGNRNGNNFGVYVYPDSTYGQYRLWKNRLPGIVAFTATADFTLTITTRTGCELVGDTVINCVSGKTYEICATYVGADDSYTCAISYRGW